MVNAAAPTRVARFLERAPRLGRALVATALTWASLACSSHSSSPPPNATMPNATMRNATMRNVSAPKVSTPSPTTASTSTPAAAAPHESASVAASRGARPQNGFLWVARGFDVPGMQSVGLLAAVRNGRVFDAAADRCHVVRKGERFTRLLGSVPAGVVELEDVSSNEANTCVGSASAPASTSFVGTTGLTTLPGRGFEVKPELMKRVVAKFGAGPPPTVTGFQSGGRRYVVAAPNVNACVPTFPFHDTMAVYVVQEGRLDAIYRHDKRVDEAGYVGGFAFVDFVQLAGEKHPWIVMLRDGCECWEFELIAAQPQKPSGPWRVVASGGSGCTT